MKRTPDQARDGKLNRIAKLIDRQITHRTRLAEVLGRASILARRQASYTGQAGRLWTRQLRSELALMARLERMASGTGPIIVGPWTGEVGYEVLYWLPFVRWFVEQYRIDPGRLHVVSRGGPVSWYGDVAGQYHDALSVFSTAEFRDQLASRHWMKQDQVSGLDREILRRARHGCHLPRGPLLHPLLMFRAFKPFWGGRVGMSDVLTRTSHRRITPPQAPAGLPAKYVAVRFYFRTSFPDTPSNRALVARALEGITETSDVVVLNPGFQIDDHRDCSVGTRHRIHTIEHLVTPSQNLEIQTAVLAGADAFVGSYGGFSYLAPLLGVRSISFFSHRTFKVPHLELAEHVFTQVGGASLTTVDVADVEQLAAVLPVAATRGL